VLDTGGRIDRFNKRFGAAKKQLVVGAVCHS
jgi:ribosomal protein L31